MPRSAKSGMDAKPLNATMHDTARPLLLLDQFLSSHEACLSLTLIMADYIKGFFGAQKAPTPANEDGMLLPAGENPKVEVNVSNFSQTLQTSPEPQILLLLQYYLLLQNLQLLQAPHLPVGQMSSSPNGTASGNERVPQTSTPRPSFYPSSS